MKHQRVGIINTVVGANNVYTGDSENTIVCVLNSTNPLVEYIGALPKKQQSYTGTVQFPRVERTHIQVLGIDTETVSSSTRYSVEMSCPIRKKNSAEDIMNPYAYTIPAILTGNANTDRYNLYYALVGKINNYARNWATAYILYKYAFTLGQDSGATGATGFGSTPANNTVTYGAAVTAAGGATANIAYVDITSGTIAGNDAAGNAWVYNISAVATFTGTTTCTSADFYSAGAAVTMAIVMTLTAGSLTAGQGMAVVDDAGYYNPSTCPNRAGANTLHAKAGFLTAHTDVVRTFQYSTGLGTDLLASLPTYGVGGRENFAYGDMDLERHNPAVTFATGEAYSKISIKPITRAIMSGLANDIVGMETEYVIYVMNSDLGTPANVPYYGVAGLNVAGLYGAIGTDLGFTFSTLT